MGTDLSVVEQALREILTRAPGGRVSFPALGIALRKALPGFSPDAYGFPSLKALLHQITVPGRLVQTSPLEWWLVADGAEAPLGSGVAAGAEMSTAPAEPARSSARRARVDSAWWRAVTEFDETRHAWFDLQEEELSTDSELAAAEPERFLALPRFGLQLQRDLARAWSEEQPSPAREELLTALDAEPKLAQFLRVVRDAGFLPRWSERRLDTGCSLLLQWAKDHGIDTRIFLTQSRALPAVRTPATAALPRVSGPMFGMSIEELRPFLHRVIEEMTEPELLQVAVPSRFLVRR